MPPNGGLRRRLTRVARHFFRLGRVIDDTNSNAQGVDMSVITRFGHLMMLPIRARGS